MAPRNICWPCCSFISFGSLLWTRTITTTLHFIMPGLYPLKLFSVLHISNPFLYSFLLTTQFETECKAHYPLSILSCILPTFPFVSVLFFLFFSVSVKCQRARPTPATGRNPCNCATHRTSITTSKTNNIVDFIHAALDLVSFLRDCFRLFMPQTGISAPRWKMEVWEMYIVKRIKVNSAQYLPWEAALPPIYPS